jgi:hypothetical protein
MLKDVTRSKVLQVWFTAVVLMAVAAFALGVTVTLGTGALLVAFSLVPPAVVLMLWHRAPPPTVGEVLRGGRTLTIVLGAMLLSGTVAAQDLAQYRNFELKSNVATISGLAGVPASEARMIHERPAVLQDLNWRPSRWIVGSTSASTDPVEQIGFSFYNDQLFRVVVDYGHERTEGMTDADMTDAISAVYGAPVKRTSPPTRMASQIEAESGSPIARWGDAEHAVVLYRTSSYGEAFRLIVTQSSLDVLARKAAVQAVRLDDQEAPRREIARQKKEKDDGRSAAEKARIANKAIFKP